MSGRESSSFGKRLSRFIIVISSLTVGLSLLSQGLISINTLGIFLVLVLVAAVLDSVWTKLVLALAGLSFFLLNYTQYNSGQFKTLLGAVGPLLILLFGLFVMFGGLRRK